jgi:hypothetical protein
VHRRKPPTHDEQAELVAREIEETGRDGRHEGCSSGFMPRLVGA